MTMQSLLPHLKPGENQQPDCSTAQATPFEEVRAGSLCPRCEEGRLDYDGLLQLSCPVCFWTQGGGSFT